MTHPSEKRNMLPAYKLTALYAAYGDWSEIEVKVKVFNSLKVPVQKIHVNYEKMAMPRLYSFLLVIEYAFSLVL